MDEPFDDPTIEPAPCLNLSGHPIECRIALRVRAGKIFAGCGAGRSRSCLKPRNRAVRDDKNIAKGIRRIDVLCEGNIEETKQFMDVLPQALETSAEIVTLALDQTVREIELAEQQEAEARDKVWRENFCPHAVVLTERTVPSPIFVAAIIGIEKLLRIDLDATQGPVSFVRQVLDRLPEGVPAFGKPIGFVIKYSPDKAVRFDSNGQPIAMLDKAVRPGTAVLRLGGRPITAEALGLVFDN
jgi:hypothetical protein